MNLVKKSLVEEGTRGRVRASGGVKVLIKASLLPALNFRTRHRLASSSCSLVESVERLTQRFRQARDPGAIIMEI